MQEIITDVAIIGAGTAGIEANHAAKEAGAKTLLIDQSPIGPTNIKTGTVPMQILRELSFSKNHIAPSSLTLYGKTPEIKIDNKEILSIVRKKKTTFIEEFIKTIYAIPENERMIGKAFFINNTTLGIESSDIQIKAKSIIIATGSQPYVPYGLKRLGSKILTTNEFFDLPELPKSVAIFGSGSVGLELGQILSQLNIKTIIFGLDSFWRFTDQKVAQEALTALKQKAYIIMNSRITEMNENENGDITIYYLDDTNYECILNVQYVICATGRIPKLDDLQLHTTGIIHNALGAPFVNPLTMQTNIKNIFVAGDVSTDHGTLQTAIFQGKVAGENAARYPEPPLEKTSFRQEIIYTSPEMAIVGESYSELTEKAKKGRRFIVGEATCNNNLLAKLKEEKYGIIHTYFAEDNGEFLGAEMCIPDAQYICQFLNCALINKMSITELLNSTFYHPSFFEVLQESVKDAERKFNLNKYR